MAKAEEIQQQIELLTKYRDNLAHLLRQAATYGGEMQTPIRIANEIQGVRENIGRIKKILRRWSVDVEDLPDDGNVSSPSWKATSSSQGASEVINCPYPGMRPFTVENADYFFGRSRDRDDVIRRLKHRNRLYVIGPSGVGKSSFVYAGIVASLLRRQPGQWFLRAMRPGEAETPIQALTHALGISPQGVGQISDPLVHIQQLLQQHENKKFLLVVDQLEELFAQFERSHQAAFINTLLQFVRLPRCALIVRGCQTIR